MARSDDIVGYTYRAANYCPNCIAVMFSAPGEPYRRAEGFLDELARQIFRSVDRQDERTVDSDWFPKALFRDQADDTGEHCGRCGEPLVHAQIP